MPTGRRSQALTRLLTLIVLAIAVVVLAVVLFSSGESYRVTLTLDNASQLVTGNQVKVGGVAVGTVSKLELGDDAQALVEIEITDDELTPLHRGSTAEVRSTSLSGIANRYVALKPGPNDEEKIEDGGAIAAIDAESEVDLDAVLNTLTPSALADLRALVGGLGASVDGRGKELEAAITALNPALAQTAATAREIVRDEPRFAALPARFGTGGRGGRGARRRPRPPRPGHGRDPECDRLAHGRGGLDSAQPAPDSARGQHHAREPAGAGRGPPAGGARGTPGCAAAHRDARPACARSRARACG